MEKKQGKLQCLIWGVGKRGKRIASRLRQEEVIAFIDSDPDKVGGLYQGKKIISFDEYLERYSNYFILISPIKSDQRDGIKQMLLENGICQYFDLLDCPSELQSQVSCETFDDHIRSFNQGKRYGVYGTGFYSIYFYQRMLESGCTNLYLIPEENTSPEMADRISRGFDFVQMIPNCNWQQHVDEILVTVDLGACIYELQKKCSLPVHDAFDLMHKIPEYRNMALEKFRNINQNGRCFIVGTGPSLRMEDLDKLEKYHEKSIGVNRVYLAFEKTDWRPDYYVVSDAYCIEEDEEIIKSFSAGHKFVSDAYPPFWEATKADNIYRYHTHWFMAPGKLPAFSEDIRYGIYGSGTVTYEAIQLAAYMGFREIYLLGVDFSFSENYKAVENHFSPQYYKKKSQTGVFAKEQVFNAFLAAKKYADEHGIKIYNATRGGKLEVFERVDFDSLFGTGESQERGSAD